MAGKVCTPAGIDEKCRNSGTSGNWYQAGSTDKGNSKEYGGRCQKQQRNAPLRLTGTAIQDPGQPAPDRSDSGTTQK